MFNKDFFEEVELVATENNIPWDSLKNKTVLVTGATGLIGTTIIYALDYANIQHNLNLSIFALVREKERAYKRFEDIKTKNLISYIVGDVAQRFVVENDIDYIIHGASQTASKEFVNHAVETIQTAVLGTVNMLELAKEKRVSGFVYMSSMEIYGSPEKGAFVYEDDIGTFSPFDLRNSYPISKLVSENLCCAYAAEYHVPAKIVRLTQTYGHGVSEADTRVFAYFNKCIQERKDIILKTKGDTERSFLKANDAASAILTVLLKGEPGKAYNAADEDTYCSIAEMAERIARTNGLSVKYDIQDEAVNGYPKPVYMKLSSKRLRNLGWNPIKD